MAPFPLAVDGAAGELEPLCWRLRLPGQRLQLPNLRLSDPALRPSLWGQVPADPAGLACRTARRGWLGLGQRGLLPPPTCWSWVPAAVACHPGSSPARVAATARPMPASR